MVVLFGVVAAVVVFAMAAIVVGPEAHRLDAVAPRAVYMPDEATDFVCDRLPPESQARLTPGEVEQLVHRSGSRESDTPEVMVEVEVGDLNEDHWKVINFMRKVYDEDGDAPSIRRLTKESGVDTKSLYKLFPKGPAKKAAKISGLPKPKGCI